tara:strand:+ start:263 stop:781 length:519 start_codon:yes stop_codon:yes gene_type:complete
MALWGTKDTVYSTGNVNVNVTTGVVTRQSGAIAWTGVSVGDVITVDGTAEGVILSIDDSGPGAGAQITITTENLPSSNISDKTYEIRQKPKSTIHDTNYGATEIFGVDPTEQGVANAASGDLRKYAPAHAGWVGIQTYVDQHGNFRCKTETLVAASSISGTDSSDDAKFADS